MLVRMPEWYTHLMGTVHPRIQVTPDDPLLAAIARGEARWPGASRSEVIRRLALDGDRSALEEATVRRTDRERALAELRALAKAEPAAHEHARLRREWER